MRPEGILASADCTQFLRESPSVPFLRVPILRIFTLTTDETRSVWHDTRSVRLHTTNLQPRRTMASQHDVFDQQQHSSESHMSWTVMRLSGVLGSTNTADCCNLHLWSHWILVCKTATGFRLQISTANSDHKISDHDHDSMLLTDVSASALSMQFMQMRP